MARRGTTTDPELADIYTAAMINTALRGPFVAPWEVRFLDDATIDTFFLLANRVPKMQAGIARIEQRKAQIRANHPAYKKH